MGVGVVAASWFRSWHGAPTDTRWLVIARNAGVTPGMVSAIAWALCDHSSQQSDRGSVEVRDAESYAVWAGYPEDEVAAVIFAMADKGIIVDGYLAAKTNPGVAGNDYRDSDRTPGSDRSRRMPHAIPYRAVPVRRATSIARRL